MEKSASPVSEAKELTLPLSAEEVGRENPTSGQSVVCSRDEEMLDRLERCIERHINSL